MPLFFVENTENTILTETEGVADVLIADELQRSLTEAELKEFLNSEECEALVEARLLNRKTIVRLNKADDLKRRKRLVALQIAKNKKDPLVKLYAKIIKQKFAILDKIEQKYGSLADREAKKAQKEYYKKVPVLRNKIPGIDSSNFKNS